MKEDKPVKAAPPARPVAILGWSTGAWSSQPFPQTGQPEGIEGYATAGLRSMGGAKPPPPF